MGLLVGEDDADARQASYYSDYIDVQRVDDFNKKGDVDCTAIIREFLLYVGLPKLKSSGSLLESVVLHPL